MKPQDLVESRGNEYCRGCYGAQLFSGLDLGHLPIANELPKTPTKSVAQYPLNLKICLRCGLGQVADVVTPAQIFSNYRYLSSVSTTFQKHALDFVSDIMKRGQVNSQDWVLEIASNDGYLLKNFLPYGIEVIGVEPAKNIAEIAETNGVTTINKFFDSKLAKSLLLEKDFPKLIIANNVMAHVPDLADFIQGLSILCGPETLISIENPSFKNILQNLQFDTIYHEHYSYLSVTSVNKLTRNYGLHLAEVEFLPTHGGTNRYWLRASRVPEIFSENVKQEIEAESSIELFSPQRWKDFSLEVANVLSDFEKWLLRSFKEGRRVYGFGAAAKASTLLNSVRVDAGALLGIADSSPEKQGRFMPNHGIKIISPLELKSESPTDILIFPWNIKAEITSFLRQLLGEEVNIWCALPNFHQVKL